MSAFSHAEYEAFIKGKLTADIASGFDCDVPVGPLFDFQAACVKWALKRGRAALFADTGLGKTAMQTTWAQAVAKHTGGNVIIAAPLCVAQQTVEEAGKFGITVRYCREQSQVEPGITITNYEMLDQFDLESFAGVVLDESSILKSHTSKTREQIVTAFKRTPYKLSCTATPSPNDYMELGNQADFLGVMSAQEMLATFFTHDGGDTSKWRLKGHGKTRFWEWMATWSICIRNPADLGFDGSRYELPPVNMIEHTVSGGDLLEGQLFAVTAQTLSERREAKRNSMADRVKLAASIVFESINKECSDGLEARICSAQEGEVPKRSSGKGEKVGSGHIGCRCKENVHEVLCKGEPGEIQKNTGATGKSQRGSQEEICREAGIEDFSESKGKGLAGSQSGKNTRSTDKEIRANSIDVFGIDGEPTPSMCNMRVFGQDREEAIPNDRPLPQNGEGAGNSVCELQSRNRNVQGQHRTDGVGDSVFKKEPWIVWCHLNDEQEALQKIFGDECFSVQGSDSIEQKERAINGWLRGERPVMISKPSIMGYGMNFQHCSKMVFAGMDDSFEKYYQAVRRSHRFGQTRRVEVHIITAETEGAVKANIERKQAQAIEMAEQMVSHMRTITRSQITGATSNTESYSPTMKMVIPSWIKPNKEN